VNNILVPFVIKMSIFGGQNSRKDVYITSTFAHGFDEFVTTRPPTTTSTSIKNDEK
jgi:sugar lactone lactonase YvrE